MGRMERKERNGALLEDIQRMKAAEAAKKKPKKKAAKKAVKKKV